MVRSIKLRWASSHYRLHEHDGIRLRFDVVCATGLDSRIFAYRMQPVSAANTSGFFSHICSPVDLAEYPADEPTAGQSPEWFRLSYVDVLVRSVEEAENLVAIIRSDVRRILHTLASMDTLIPGGVDINGPDCDPDVDEDDDEEPVDSESSSSYGALQELFVTGTSEQFVGVGVSWANVGEGAGSPVGVSDGFGDNSSRVDLQPGQTSQLLLVQGFDFSDLPDDCVVEGVQSQVTLRDATSGEVTNDNSLNSNTASESVSITCPRLSFLALQHPDLGMSEDRSGPTDLTGPDWEVIIRGGDGDRWGFTSLPAGTLKDGAFGIGILIAAADTDAASVIVDGVKLRVFYREVT